MGMGSELKEMLMNICFNGQWDYAVFWKIKHGDRMVLTWDDDYYKNHSQQDPLKTKFFDETVNKLPDRQYQYDFLRLAVAKMSCHVYSLGEGIIGKVAATGKHQWIFADNYMTNSSLSFEYADEWRTHFSAGIKTLVFVAVVPHGVVQLGSFNKVLEDMKIVKHVGEVFFSYHTSSLGQIYSPISNYAHLPDLYTKGSGVGGSTEMQNNFYSMLQSLDKGSNSSPYTVSLPSIHQRETIKSVNNLILLDSTLPAGNQIDKLLGGRDCLIDASANGNVGTNNFSSYLQNSYMEDSQYSNAFSANSNHAAFPHISPDMFYCASEDMPKFDGVKCIQGERLSIQNHSHMLLEEVQKKNLEVCSESSYTDVSNSSFKFSTGSELLEALGSTFSKQSHCDREAEMADVGTSTSSKLPEATRRSPLSSDSDSDNLLEAVVANIFQNRSDCKSEKSSYKSEHSLVTTGITPEPVSDNKQSILSVGCSIDQRSHGEENSQLGLSSSEVGIVRFHEGYSSSCLSTHSEQIEKSSEPATTNKKRAKPGENCRPRPRDRQLIQDRIKELRELVPSGSKCSIDALLERTIKHMLFLQSITKHTDKLQKCAESKVCSKESGIPGSSNLEQGSSWAVEVGSHLKVCTIKVENLNMNGQMIVEVLCEGCSHFLEIAEAIRSLGLTILKGFTESHGGKTWICFVIEGQNDRSMHRMDILWSLVKIFQPETTSSHSSAALKDTAMQAPL